MVNFAHVSAGSMLFHGSWQSSQKQRWSAEQPSGGTSVVFGNRRSGIRIRPGFVQRPGRIHFICEWRLNSALFFMTRCQFYFGENVKQDCSTNAFAGGIEVFVGTPFRDVWLDSRYIMMCTCASDHQRHWGRLGLLVRFLSATNAVQQNVPTLQHSLRSCTSG